MINGKRLYKSFGYAFYGINHAFNNDQNLIIHFLVATAVVILGVILEVSTLEMAILILTILIVIATEMINSAVERIVDLITKEHRLDAKIAKDVSSGMVLVTAIGSVFVGMVIFMPHIVSLLK